jgi:nucleoid DNA-binding protein
MRSPALERGERVELRGVGVLTVKEKRERRGRNPSTGEALIIDPHRVVRFRVSELLLARLNQTSRRPERPKSDPRQLAPD